MSIRRCGFEHRSEPMTGATRKWFRKEIRSPEFEASRNKTQLDVSSFSTNDTNYEAYNPFHAGHVPEKAASALPVEEMENLAGKMAKPAGARSWPPIHGRASPIIPNN